MNDDYFSLTDEFDHQIIMHRNAHFSGSFSLMEEYYINEAKGAMPEFELPRIRTLAALENEDPYAFSDLLTPSEMAEVEKARQLYQNLRKVYEEESVSPIPKAIADLLLSEDEDSKSEIEALVDLGKEAVPALITVVQNDDLFNSLFPGYGFAPAAAMLALGKIGDSRAIIPLFEAMAGADFFTESVIIDAFKLIGEPAKSFLLSRLKNHPLTQENTQAAVALAAFQEDSEVIRACLDLLEVTATQPSYLNLSNYLLMNCSATQDSQDKSRLTALAENPSLPTALKEEFKMLKFTS
jgi:HEAT repeat protein